MVFKNSAHAPTNEARHNIVNLIKNDREAMKNTNMAKKKATTKFKSDGTHQSGKMVGVAGAPMGLKGLRKAKKSKKRALQKSMDEEGAEGEKKAFSEALNNESAEALKEHAEEMTAVVTTKKQRRKMKTEARARRFRCLFNIVCCFCILGRCFVGAVKNCLGGFSKMITFFYAYIMWEFFGKVTHSVNKEQYLLEKYMDQRGELIAAFQTLRLSDQQRLRWVELWSMIDADENNTMDIDEFLSFFDLVDKKDMLYTKRLFAIFNRNFNGFVNIRDFLVTTWLYCTFDATRVAEISFRLLSRRGDVFEPDTTIIDLVDIEAFAKARYDPLGRNKETSLKKIAVAIFAFLDVDGSGGVGFDEFLVFSKQNPIFLYYGHWFQTRMREAIFGEQYWRDETNARPEMFTRDVMQEAMLRDNIQDQLASLGILGEEIQKKKGNKFKLDFPEAWYKQKEDAFLAKQALKDRQDLANEMAKHTFARMVKVFTKLVPDAIGLRPAFAIWKDWVDYDKSLHEDGGESYALSHMSLMDVKDAVRAKSLGLTTKKLEAVKVKAKMEEGKEDKEIQESVHDQVIRESALGSATDNDLISELMTSYTTDLNSKIGTTRTKRIIDSVPYEMPLASPVKALGSLGNRGRYDLVGDDDSEIKMLQMEYGLTGDGVGRDSPISPSRLDLNRIAGGDGLTVSYKSLGLDDGNETVSDWDDDSSFGMLDHVV